MACSSGVQGFCSEHKAAGASLRALHTIQQPTARSAPLPDTTPPTAAEHADLARALTREEAEVLLHHGTEAPFCGGLLHVKEPGYFLCAGCGLPLFRTGDKFESGTGWPSFFDALPNAVVLEKDNSIPFMPRTEVGGWVGVWWGRWLVGTASSIEVVLGAFKYAGTVP